MSLCQICARKVGTCSWERDFTPVPGWDAIPTKVLMQSGVREQSYNVVDCPLYVSPEHGRISDKEKNVPHPIIAINMETGKITRYDSIYQAAKLGGFDPYCIRRVLKGKAQYHKKHYFKESEVF